MAVRRARFKPTANLSIKRPASSNNRPAILRAPKSEKEDGPSSAPPSPDVKSEPVAVPKPENAAKPPPLVESTTNPQFLPPSRPSPAPSPVLSPAPPPPSRSPQPQPARPSAHVVARSPAHPSLSAMDDSLFKSPIMSPSYPPPPSRTPNPYAMKTMSPNPHPPSPLLDSPGSPNKARPRIRHVPLIHPLYARRGEDDDIIRIQRVRHMSTSSTTSLTKFVPQQVGRIRTESTCSAYSDVSVFKPRRSGRSDEYLRLCEARRDLLKKCNGDAPDKTQLRMYDMIYYNPKTNPMKRHLEEERSEEGGANKSKERRISVSSARSPTKTVLTSPVKVEEPKKKEEPQEPAAMPVPQLKLGANGEMILDEKSLTIEMTGEREARERIANADIIYDDLNSSNGFYKRHTRTKDWPADETIRFYRCLQVIGTDFSLMNSLFPKRSRRDLKLKFKKEEKTNGFLVNKALIEHTSFDIGQLEETFRKEEEEKEEEIRELEAAAEKALEAKTEMGKKLKQKRTRGMSRAAKAMDDQDLDLEKAQVHKLRQTKPRKVRRAPPKVEALDVPLAGACPPSPASVPPASPCKTPNWPSSPQIAERETPTRMPTPINNDMNLNCRTRGQRTVSECSVASWTAPKSVEMIQELSDCGEEERKPLAMMTKVVTKKEKEDPKVTESEQQKGKSDAKDTEKVGEVEPEEQEDDDEDDEEGGIDGLDLSNLVVLEALNDRGEKTFNVHFMDRETEEMSEEPLDLPQEVIDYIVDTLDSQKVQKAD